MDNKTILSYTNAQSGGIPRGRVVVIGANDTVTLANSAAAISMGITTELSTALGERVDVNHLGIEKAETGAAFAAGVRLTCDSIGRVIPTTTVGQYIIGRALKAATGVAGERIPVLITLDMS